MKAQVNSWVFFGAIALVVVIVGYLLYFYTESPFNRPGGPEAMYRKIEAQAKRQGVDLRKDPFTAQLYYKYHPEEKPKEGLPNPMGAGAPQPGRSPAPTPAGG